MREVNYVIAEETAELILLKDVDPHDKYFTITNRAEYVVAELAERLNGRRLEYIDTGGERD